MSLSKNEATNISAIKNKTDALPASPANEVTLSAVKLKTDNIPAYPAAQATSDAIKLKTDLIPAIPTSKAMTDALAAVIGTLNDYVGVPYVFGANTIMAQLNTNYYHAHGRALCYPNLASNVVLTSGSGVAWAEGNKIEVVPAGALNVAAFDLHWINVSDISGNAQIQINIYSGALGAEVLICSIRTHRNAVQAQEGSKAVHVPPQVAGTRISCTLSNSSTNAITCGVGFEGHYYAI